MWCCWIYPGHNVFIRLAISLCFWWMSQLSPCSGPDAFLRTEPPITPFDSCFT